ncbi:MAG: urate hydroxylase PuuD [Gemmatimonadota bacterium]|nr:urate hydroxylase PuuD [Gemmatimonadota bacterium]
MQMMMAGGPWLGPRAIELIDLVARWAHVIAGIMWIGNSLLWNWIDRSLVPRADGARTQTPEPVGSIWLLHSGAFYYMEKTLLAGAPMPRRLHWFKWQAYATWLSGFVLLLAVYWLGGRAAMTDPAVADITQGMAVAIGAGGILAGGLLYEFAHRAIAPSAPRAARLLWIVALSAIAVAFTQLLNGRAAFLHVGAMLGTIMAGNVVFTIMPAQRELVAAVQATGTAPSVASEASTRAKRVSTENNYIVFPVIALMLSGHYAAVYGYPHPWIPLAILVAGGASVRHVLNLRFTVPDWRPRLALTLLATVAALYATLRDGARARPAAAATAASAATAGPVDFADVRHVIDRRCGACHSSAPSDESFGAVPAGVMFDTPEQIVAFAPRIQERAVVTRTMPPANKTRITDAERDLLGRWIAEGAGRVP